MNVIRQLEDQFFEIDNEYSRKEFQAHIKGHFLKEAFWQKKRELNTHAYFLFLFTRLESHIKTESTLLIDAKKNSIAHWKTRSIWEVPDTQKLYFKKQLSLLTEQGNNDYNLISNYYAIRNTIAHGGTIQGITLAINMIDVFNDMKRLHKTLKR